MRLKQGRNFSNELRKDHAQHLSSPSWSEICLAIFFVIFPQPQALLRSLKIIQSEQPATFFPTALGRKMFRLKRPLGD